VLFNKDCNRSKENKLDDKRKPLGEGCPKKPTPGVIPEDMQTWDGYGKKPKERVALINHGTWE